MVEEIFPNIYRMEIPLPDNPRRAVNSYVIKGDERYLIFALKGVGTHGHYRSNKRAKEYQGF